MDKVKIISIFLIGFLIG